LAELGGELVDQFRGGGEECVEAVLDGTVSDGDGEVSLASTGLRRSPLYGFAFSSLSP
jgi:hypothetical protein